jgi:hypothetical protein
MGKLAQYSKKIQKEREERAVRMKGAVTKISLNREEHELGGRSVSKRTTSPRFLKENVSSHCPCPRFSHPSGAASAKRRNCRPFDEHEVRLEDDWGRGAYSREELCTCVSATC